MGDVPFRDVYIHALVRDLEGQKMSKSKGNVIDPLVVMDRYGTDAFRFTLAALSAMGRDVKMAENRVSGYQNFVNKLWNASRFTFMHLEDQDKPYVLEANSIKQLNLADQWILSRLADTVDQARKAIDGYRFNEYAHHLYQFTWHEFCDWYLEMSKPSLGRKLGNEAQQTRQVLKTVLEQVLLLLHPIMPFVTEEIWQVLRQVDGNASIMLQPYPKPQTGWRQPEVEKKVSFLTEIIRAIRNLRSELNIPPGRFVEIIVVAGDREAASGFLSLDLMRDQETYIRTLARVSSVTYVSSRSRPKSAPMAIVGGTEIFLPVPEEINLHEEETRINREVAKLQVELSRTQKKLTNEEFLKKAKPEIVEKEKGKAVELEGKLHTLSLSLKRLQELQKQRKL